ncbi:MAG: phosphohydrolase [Peptoniphilaceae bacterium]|nr:hydrolase [Peptoniphilaceae bacterium]MDY3738581.1 phosphohydrolase [Peptoniphilaceae bacterium]
MIKIEDLNLDESLEFEINEEYKKIIKDILEDEAVQSMDNFIQHADISTLKHSIDVSYKSFLWAKKFSLDYKSAARGGLLHDFYLYDWHNQKPEKGLHGFVHPKIALENANKHFKLNEVEKDAIKKHMWPLTVVPPLYAESLIVNIADDICSVKEVKNYDKGKNYYKSLLFRFLRFKRQV